MKKSDGDSGISRDGFKFLEQKTEKKIRTFFAGFGAK